MTVVKVYSTRPEAEMFASVLREYGIACMVQADNCGGGASLHGSYRWCQGAC